MLKTYSRTMLGRAIASIHPAVYGASCWRWVL